jgi:hypothetical protein
MMKPQKLLNLCGLIFVVLSLAACGGAAASTVSPTDTPIPPTDTPVPPTTTPIPEPLPATGGESAIDPLAVGDPERGREIFETGGGVMSMGCTGCHSLDGSSLGTSFEYGPSMQGLSEIAGDRVPGLSAAEYLRQSIVDPSAYVVAGYEDSMRKTYQAFLSEEDLDALVAFLLTQ